MSLAGRVLCRLAVSAGALLLLVASAEIIAQANARADMQARSGDQLTGLKATLQDRADGTIPSLIERWLVTEN